jgi:hypothetical protein
LTIDDGGAMREPLHMAPRITPALVFAPLLALGALQTGCGTPPPPVVVTPPAPKAGLPWQALSLPRSTLKVPALLGKNEVPSNACFTDLPATTGTALAEGEWTFEQKDELDAKFKASISAFVAEAKLEAQMAKALSQRWEVEVTGVTYDSVDPATVTADFDNAQCTDADLEWLKDKRFVVTEALKAATVKVKIGSALSASEKAEFDAAIDQLNVKLNTAFSHASSASNSTEFTASNVYVGVRGNELGAFACKLDQPLELAADTQVSICDGKYSVAVSKSLIGGGAIFKLTPERLATQEFPVTLGNQVVHKVGSLAVVFVMAEAAGDKFRLRKLEVLKVGTRG